MKKQVNFLILYSLCPLAELKASFPDGTVLTDSDTVLQCVGVEFYNRAGADGYVLYSTGNMIVYDVF
jgi:hypothetical protein